MGYAAGSSSTFCNLGGGRVGVDHDQFVHHMLTPIGPGKHLDIAVERRSEEWRESVFPGTAEHTEGK